MHGLITTFESIEFTQMGLGSAYANQVLYYKTVKIEVGKSEKCRRKI